MQVKFDIYKCRALLEFPMAKTTIMELKKKELRDKKDKNPMSLHLQFENHSPIVIVFSSFRNLST